MISDVNRDSMIVYYGGNASRFPTISRALCRFSRVNVLLDPFVPLTTPVTVRSMSCGLPISLRSVWPAFDTFSANVYFIHTAVLGLSHFKQLLR